MSLVYLSGAITGATDNELALFREAAAYLSIRGQSVFNPLDHDIPEANTSHDAWTRALARDIGVICSPECRGICVLDTFGRSKGALLEIFTAISLQREIVLLPHQSPGWIEHVELHVRRAQDTLWEHVLRDRYTHHADIEQPKPVTLTQLQLILADRPE